MNDVPHNEPDRKPVPTHTGINPTCTPLRTPTPCAAPLVTLPLPQDYASQIERKHSELTHPKDCLLALALTLTLILRTTSYILTLTLAGHKTLIITPSLSIALIYCNWGLPYHKKLP